MFIVFEGIDGAGKSTLIKNFKEYLDSQNISCIVTAEPRGEQLGADLYKLVKEHKIHDQISLLFLIAAARRERLKRVILPALKRGDWILCDRWIYSTIAYQQGIYNLDPYLISVTNQAATDGLEPDRVVWLNTPLQTCLDRVLERDGDQGIYSYTDLANCQDLYQALVDYNWRVYCETPLPETLYHNLIAESP
jgi:dTMP kinase